MVDRLHEVCELLVCADSPTTMITPRAVVNDGDEVTFKCSVQFGGPRNTSRHLSTEQFPRLTMTLNDVELTESSRHYTDGQPAQQRHIITRVSTTALSLSVCLPVCLSVCLQGSSSSQGITILT